MASRTTNPDAPRGGAVVAGQGEDVPVHPVENTGMLVVGVLLASGIQILDTTIANVAIPHMQSALGATVDTVTWVLTSYIIASAIAMPATGWLANRIGSRNLFLASVSSFILASMACGMAQNLEQMVVFRAIQGVAGAFLVPLSQSSLLNATRPSKHPQMIALWGMGVIIAPIIGPITGGWLTENLNWRWVFYVNVPLGAIALAMLFATLPSHREKARRFDIFGFAMIALALAALQMMLDRGHSVDWFDSWEIWIYAGVILSAGWVAVVHLVTAANPLFDRQLFQDRNFTIGLVFMVALGVVMLASMALLPPMLQNLFGYGVIDTGMVLMPRGVGVFMSMQVANLLTRRGVDPRVMVMAGFLIIAFSLWEMAQWSLQVDTYHVVSTGIVQGLGMGLCFIPLNIVAFATLPPQLRTEGSSLLNLFRSIGSSIGISLVTAVLARNIQVSHADLASHITSAAGNSMIDVATIDRYQSIGETALAIVNGEVTRQAAMVAYVDDFWMMMWVTLAVVPLPLLMRRHR